MSRYPDAIIAAARTSHRKYYPYGPFISITLAQWADESDYGTIPSGLNNFFGIKATSSMIASGNCRKRLTKEFLHGQYVQLPLYFADYPSPEACFDAHAQLLISHHYIRCMSARTPEEYAVALHLCGYATEPRYPEILMNFIRTDNLTQYDEAA